MADVFSKLKRSEVMSRIRSRGNRDTELALAKIFRRHKITGWRRQVETNISPRPSPPKSVNSPCPSPGFATLSRSRGRGTRGEGVRVKPDFVFQRLKLAISVDGCFWHGCPKHATKPKNNREFWRRKLAANKKRDALVTRMLRRTGWRVLRIWEHELARKNEARLVRRLFAFIRG